MGVLLSEPEIFLRQADVGPSADKQPEVWSASPHPPCPLPHASRCNSHISDLGFGLTVVAVESVPGFLGFQIRIEALQGRHHHRNRRWVSVGPFGDGEW